MKTLTLAALLAACAWSLPADVHAGGLAVATTVVPVTPARPVVLVPVRAVAPPPVAIHPRPVVRRVRPAWGSPVWAARRPVVVVPAVVPACPPPPVVFVPPPVVMVPPPVCAPRPGWSVAIGVRF